ncbi:hypothetical protein MRX96_015532 [Rhipicephalus microplus]
MASKCSAVILLWCAFAAGRGTARNPSSCGGLTVPPEKLVDLSYSFNNRTIFWADDAEFRLNVSRRGSTPEDWYQADVVELATHGGTHLDAPIHFAPERWTVSQIPLERLMFLPIALVDVEAQSSENPAYELSVEDIERWEAEHGHVPYGALFVERTGRYKLWPNPQCLLGHRRPGMEAFPDSFTGGSAVPGRAAAHLRLRTGLAFRWTCSTPPRRTGFSLPTTCTCSKTWPTCRASRHSVPQPSHCPSKSAWPAVPPVRVVAILP